VSGFAAGGMRVFLIAARRFFEFHLPALLLLAVGYWQLLTSPGATLSKSR